MTARTAPAELTIRSQACLPIRSSGAVGWTGAFAGTSTRAESVGVLNCASSIRGAADGLFVDSPVNGAHFHSLTFESVTPSRREKIDGLHRVKEAWCCTSWRPSQASSAVHLPAP